MTVHGEPHAVPIRWNEYLIIHWQVEAEEAPVGIVIVRFRLEYVILLTGYPSWWRKEDSCNGFDIKALDQLLLRIDKLPRILWTCQKRHRHITASILLALNRSAEMDFLVAAWCGNVHCSHI